MPGFKKLAVSMPNETYRELERARAKLKQSRSEIVSTAVTAWLRSLDADEESRRYIEGYLRIPEVVTAEDEAIAAQSVAGWDPWEPGPSLRASESREPRAGERRGPRASESRGPRVRKTRKR